MESKKTHAVPVNPFFYFVDKLVLYFTVSHMPPPDEHIGIVKHLIRQALVGHIECCRCNFDVIAFGKYVFYRVMYSFRVNFLYGFV